ncbi:MAG TPA: phage tail tip lysozyme [Polyangia bacterium]
MATATIAFGCDGLAPNSQLGINQAAASANEKTAFDYFLNKGLTNFQAAGVVGNLVQESGVNPSISQSGGGPGRGIAQWSAGARWDTTKGDNLVAFAAMEGLPTNSLMVQLDFIWYELQTFPAYGLTKLIATTDVSGASIEFENDYEGCVDANFPVCEQAMRIVYSMQELKSYGNDPVMHDGGVIVDGSGTHDGADAQAADTAADHEGTTSEDAAADIVAVVDTAAPVDTTPPPAVDAGAPAPVDSGVAVDTGKGSAPASGTSSGGCALASGLPSEGAGGASALPAFAFALSLVASRRRPRR